jgi:hypothetical protein
MLSSACNMAVSERAFFSKEQQSQSLMPRPGLWASEEGGCSFDTNLPVDQWPECAGGSLIQVQEDSITLRGAAENESYLLLPVDGDPPLVQVPINRDDPRETYAFFALDRVERDTEGRIVAADWWLVACGTEEPGSEKAQPKIQPFPGLDADCRPASVEALWAAARASRPAGSDYPRWRWVRDEPR